MSIFNFLKKKKSNLKEIEYDYKIKYNVNPPKKIYEITGEEKQFLNELFIKSNENNVNPNKFTFTRLSNGTINVDYDYFGKGGYVGKIKLQGKKKFISYMKNVYDSETVEGELYECINSIGLWISYINKYFKWNNLN